MRIGRSPAESQDFRCPLFKGPFLYASFAKVHRRKQLEKALPGSLGSAKYCLMVDTQGPCLTS